jgi:hypothetical protein
VHCDKCCTLLNQLNLSALKHESMQQRNISLCVYHSTKKNFYHSSWLLKMKPCHHNSIPGVLGNFIKSTFLQAW